MINFLDVVCDENLLTIVRFVKKGIFPIVQIGIPIILIVLGTLDLGKAVIASKEDEIKNAQKMLIKRCSYAIAIFFVVMIVQLVFGLLTSTGDAEIGSTSTNWAQCWDRAKK